MSISIQPVILCGGSGTRLWPLSRAGFPKQFLSLTGDESLFQQAVQRLAGLGNTTQSVNLPLIVGNDEHRFLVLEQLREIGIDPSALLLEPVGRNTAPALTLAALAALQNGADPVLVVTPADQTVSNMAAFNSALESAVALADSGSIVILGITPTSPETGYGYIRTAAVSAGEVAAQVQAFVEKPDEVAARGYLAAGGYFWNSGMFVLKASKWMAALEHFASDIATASRSSWSMRATDARFVRPGKAEFVAIPAESVDYAVMEHCPGSAFDLRMLALDAGWNDLGAWDAVWQVAPKDANGNAAFGDAVMIDCRDTLVHAASRLVSVVGLNNVVVIETADAVLVTDRACSQDVKKVVNRLTSEGRDEYNLHRKVQRPWGWYDSIDEGGRFKVKRIQVKPGASLSLQMHYHRAEHWVVVCGTAEITNGDKKIVLSENQSTYIPLGQVHRLANPGTIPLEIIEVQSGSYLGEDDIVRYEDTYGRAPEAKP